MFGLQDRLLASWRSERELTALARPAGPDRKRGPRQAGPDKRERPPERDKPPGGRASRAGRPARREGRRGMTADGARGLG